LAKHIFKKAKRMPKAHLAVAGTLSFLAVILSILPSSDVEATRQFQEASSTTIDLPPISANDNSTAQTESGSPVTSAEPVVPEVVWQEFTVKSGDSLSTIFNRAGLTSKDVHEVAQADKKSRVFRSLRVGQKIQLDIDELGLNQMRIIVNKLEAYEFSRNGDGYRAEKVIRTPDVKQRFVSGEITNSLFLAAKKAGLSDQTTMELADIFGWDIDFALDIRAGDQFRVLFEEKFLDGKKIGYGDILAAEFTNNGDTFAAVRYEDSDGVVNYFTPDGHSMRKAFLRSPVDFRRISSGFQKERYHPVLGVKRPHRGTDYAAATGTPIKAAGDGKVIWLGTKGGYGKTIILQHGNNITTLYGHMSKYNSKLKNGARVKQGQTIGYVGKTGTATGPHLHYEFRVAGVHKNPLTVKLPTAEPIAKKERSNFSKISNALVASLQQKAIEQIAGDFNSDNEG
jgi:murein DD-endopeptidase MepM/ murein hydrolase activator NlpD